MSLTAVKITNFERLVTKSAREFRNRAAVVDQYLYGCQLIFEVGVPRILCGGEVLSSLTVSLSKRRFRPESVEGNSTPAATASH
jgi:hypothetical protein